MEFHALRQRYDEASEKPNLFEFFRARVRSAKANGTMKRAKNQIYLSFSEREYVRHVSLTAYFST